MGVNRNVIAWLASSLVVVWGQNSNVQQCISSYNWTINSQSQTPCLVASYLRSGCGRPVTVDGIPAGTHYIGPSVAEANGCHCSSVTYSVMSACAGCQDRSYLNWTMWSYNCSVKYESLFPGDISAATSVPLWAYLNLSETKDTFDPVVAARNASITLPSSIFTTRTVGSTTTVSFLLSGFDVPSKTSSSSDSAPSLGAIVGGVLGGAVLLAIILLVLLFWFLKRRSNGAPKDIVFDRTALVSGPSTTSGTSSPFNHGSTPTQMQNTTGSPLFISSPSLPGSPFSTSRRSLEGPSASIRYFGSIRQVNRYPGPGFRTESDHGHVQI